jgi:hypothetical protein
MTATDNPLGGRRRFRPRCIDVESIGAAIGAGPRSRSCRGTRLTFGLPRLPKKASDIVAGCLVRRRKMGVVETIEERRGVAR